MNNTPAHSSDSVTALMEESPLSCAVLEAEKLAVIRLSGKGNFLTSVPLKKFSEHLQKTNKVNDLIVDLGGCETMDSTFMGVLASVGMVQIRRGARKLIIANANEHCRKLLKTLGIARLLEVHEPQESGDHQKILNKAAGQLEPMAQEALSHTDQICHTLEAHRTLVRADGENEIRFQSVIHYLEKSLETEK
ncbi:MAG: STAS domain-containing protein [Candidatus Sumerlaeia bacterium]|nr:STAS domain-containing protein [Candidatus Sumerlaeia bacterium]